MNFYFWQKYSLKQFVLYFIGIIVMPLGVVFTINAHLGAGGYDALNFALGEKLGINTSIAIYSTALLAVFITAGIRRGFPRFSTFISSFLLGLSTDFWKWVCAGVQGDFLLKSIFILLIGLVFISIGVAAYMLSGLPTNPTDDMIVAFKERGISIRAAKIGFDAVCVAIAFLMGGEIGVGTIICTFLLGPGINLFYFLIAKIIKESVNR